MSIIINNLSGRLSRVTSQPWSLSHHLALWIKHVIPCVQYILLMGLLGWRFLSMLLILLWDLLHLIFCLRFFQISRIGEIWNSSWRLLLFLSYTLRSLESISETILEVVFLKISSREINHELYQKLWCIWIGTCKFLDKKIPKYQELLQRAV